MHSIFPVHSSRCLGWIHVLTVGKGIEVNHSCVGISVPHSLRVFQGWLGCVAVTLTVCLCAPHWFPEYGLFYWCTVESIISSMFYLRTTHSAAWSWKSSTQPHEALVFQIAGSSPFKGPPCQHTGQYLSLRNHLLKIKKKSPIKDYGMNKLL